MLYSKQALLESGWDQDLCKNPEHLHAYNENIPGTF